MSDESVDNVTFVGGKAIEQHEDADSNVPASTREEALKAVREAIKGASDEARANASKAEEQDPYAPPGANKDDSSDGVKRGPDGKFQKGTAPPASAKKEPEEEEEDIDVGKASVKQVLKNREKVAAKLKQAREAATGLEAERRKLEEETRKVQDTYKQLQEWQVQVERDRARFERLRKDPAHAIREIGYDPEQFIVDLANDGTPEGQLRKQQRELAEQLQEIKSWKEQQAQQAEQFRMQQEEQKAAQYRMHIEKTFVDTAMNEEKYPHIVDFFSGRERQLIATGDLTAYEFREISGGKEGSLDEILDYIEEDLAERAERWYSKKSGTKKDTRSTEAKPGKGSKGKSLTPEASSERRSLGRKALVDLDDDDRREAAKAAVSAALDNVDD